MGRAAVWVAGHAVRSALARLPPLDFAGGSGALRGGPATQTAARPVSRTPPFLFCRWSLDDSQGAGGRRQAHRKGPVDHGAAAALAGGPSETAPEPPAHFSGGRRGEYEP